MPTESLTQFTKFDPVVSRNRPLIKAWNELRTYPRYKDIIACAKKVTNYKEVEQLLECAMWFAFSEGRLGIRISELGPIVRAVRDTLSEVETVLSEVIANE